MYIKNMMFTILSFAIGNQMHAYKHDKCDLVLHWHTIPE